MSRKRIVYTLFILISGLLILDVVAFGLTQEHLTKVPETGLRRLHVLSFSSRCNSGRPIKGLEKSSNSYLKKLSEYQEACQSLATDRIMIYTDIPKDERSARIKAFTTAQTLSEFAEFGVKPIVMVEPITDWGILNFSGFKSGEFDKSLDLYFKQIKALGIDEEEMGMWVIFPEANLPYWNRSNIKAEEFGGLANRYLSIYKSNFPNGKASLLLNSATYETPDFKWTEGRYLSLKKYVEGIDKNLVDSVGLSGFPWLPPQGSNIPGVTDAGEFLNHKIITEAASILGVKEVWFNTGTFSAIHTLEQDKAATVTVKQRQAILEGIYGQAEETKKLGFNVNMNLSALDQSMDVEAADWSYWKPGEVFYSDFTPTFVNFAAKLTRNQIGLSIYDHY